MHQPPTMPFPLVQDTWRCVSCPDFMFSFSLVSSYIFATRSPALRGYGFDPGGYKVFFGYVFLPRSLKALFSQKGIVEIKTGIVRYRLGCEGKKVYNRHFSKCTNVFRQPNDGAGATFFPVSSGMQGRNVRARRRVLRNFQRLNVVFQPCQR